MASAPLYAKLRLMHSVRKWLEQARSVAVLTGAGVSAESGVPTFRDADGLWNQYRVQDLATPSAFARDPKLVWEWYNWRRSVLAEVKPNPGHFALAELERRVESFTLITQNVDGLHELAGSRNVLRLDGSGWAVVCFAPLWSSAASICRARSGKQPKQPPDRRIFSW